MDITIYNLIFSFFLGAFIGRLLNVMIWSLEVKNSLVSPRSYCPKCQSKFRWNDDISLLSYLFYRNKCFNCKQRISLRYPMGELLCPFLFALCNFANPDSIFTGSEEMILISGFLAVNLISLSM